jgi:hypothetical protein
MRASKIFRHRFGGTPTCDFNFYVLENLLSAVIVALYFNASVLEKSYILRLNWPWQGRLALLYVFYFIKIKTA